MTELGVRANIQIRALHYTLTLDFVPILRRSWVSSNKGHVMVKINRGKYLLNIFSMKSAGLVRENLQNPDNDADLRIMSKTQIEKGA